MTLAELTAAWAAEAQRFREWGQESPARLLERCVADLQGIRTPEDRLVTYEEAATISGYSTAQLRRLVRNGVLLDRATAGPTLLAVADLPRRPRRVRAA